MCDVNMTASSLTCIVPSVEREPFVNVTVRFVFDDYVSDPIGDIQFYPPPVFNSSNVTYVQLSNDNITVFVRHL
jgi:hypothetical protein